MGDRIRVPARGWKPRPYQMRAWEAMEDGVKRISLLWHRRSGKDEVALNRAAVAAFERVGNYWHMLPQADQARKAIWDAIDPNTGHRRLDDIFPREYRSDTRQNDMFIRFKNGSTWQLVGSDNYGSLVGSPPVGVVFSEWARANPQAWAYLSPILAENNGWAIFVCTPLGRNHAWRTHESLQVDPFGFAETLTVGQTGVFDSATIEAEKMRLIDIYGRALGEALYQQEYYCSANAAIVGSVYGSEISEIKNAGRVGHIDTLLVPVNTAWDMGRSDATAIWWFQSAGNEVRILDYHEQSLQDLGYYSEQIRGYRIRSELSSWAYGHEPILWGDPIPGLEHRRAWAYGTHYLPHDASHKTLSASGISAEQILRKGLGQVRVLKETQRGLDDAARSAVVAMLRKAWVHERALSGLDTLSEYRYSYDEERRTMSAQPIHDYASHCADGARTMALAVAGGAAYAGDARCAKINYPNLGIA